MLCDKRDGGDFLPSPLLFRAISSRRCLCLDFVRVKSGDLVRSRAGPLDALISLRKALYGVEARRWRFRKLIPAPPLQLSTFANVEGRNPIFEDPAKPQSLAKPVSDALDLL